MGCCGRAEDVLRGCCRGFEGTEGLLKEAEGSAKERLRECCEGAVGC